MTVVRVAGRRIDVSNPDKVLFPDTGVTKGDVVRYYRRVAERMLAYLHDRPLVLHRYPDGLRGESFYQKHVPDHFPDWIRTVELEKRQGGATTYVVCDDAATLVYLADQAALVPHVLLAQVDRPEHPDQLVFDLDPSGDDERQLSHVSEGARLIRAVLERIGLTPFVKSSGSRGLHIHVNLDRRSTFDESRDLATAVARIAADQAPDRLTVAHRKEQRHGRVFIDIGRNAYGQHVVAPYALRAHPGAPVAVPLDWKEAASARFHPRHYTIGNIFRRLGRKQDPWARMSATHGSAGAARERLDEWDRGVRG